MSAPLESIRRQVDRLPAHDRPMVEEGLASVAALMVEADPATLAEVTESLQRLDPQDSPQGETLEARNLLRIFRDWQRVRNESITTGDLAEFGISRQVLEQRRKAGKLIALRVPFKSEFLYPVWQFDPDGRPFEVIPRMVEAAQGARLSPTDLHFFMTRRDDNDVSWADRLRDGQDEAVLEAVRAAGALGG